MRLRREWWRLPPADRSPRRAGHRRRPRMKLRAPRTSRSHLRRRPRRRRGRPARSRSAGFSASKDANGADVSCAIVKTWREKDIGKMLGGRFEWPWGNAVCQSKLELKRADLARAMSEDSAEVALGNQKIRCTLAQKGGRCALRGRRLDRAEGLVREGKGGRSEAELGRGVWPDARLRPDLCGNGRR